VSEDDAGSFFIEHSAKDKKIGADPNSDVDWALGWAKLDRGKKDSSRIGDLADSPGRSRPTIPGAGSASEVHP